VLATKKVGVEPGLVPRLTGGWLRPCLPTRPAITPFNVSSRRSWE